MKKQSLIKGSLILGLAGILAKFLGLFFRWPLIMLIGDEGIGYYQMSYPLYMFFIALATGVPVAVSKIVSEKNALGRNEEAFQVVKEALIAMLILGIGTSIFLGGFSKVIISTLHWDEKAYYSIMGICLAPIFIGIMTPFRGFFQGFQNMSPSAISQIIEQIGRVVIGVGLAFLLFSKGIEYSAGGAAFGAAAGAFFSGVYLISKYLKVKSELGIKRVKSSCKVMREVLKVAIPISVGAAVGSIMSLIDSVLVPQKLLQAGFDTKTATILYAQLTGKAGVLVNIPMTLSIALSTSVIPIIAEKYVLNDKKGLNDKIDMAIKLCLVIGIPCFLGLYFMAEPIMRLLFPGKFDGFMILKYLSISVPFIIITQITTSILQGTGYYFKPIKNLMFGCIVKVILTMILIPIPKFNIYGAVIATVSAYLFVAILNIIAMKKRLGYAINYIDVLIKPSIAAGIMINGVLFVYLILNNYTGSNGLSCLISIFVGIIIYVVLILAFKVFRYEYIKSRAKKSRVIKRR